VTAPDASAVRHGTARRLTGFQSATNFDLGEIPMRKLAILLGGAVALAACNTTPSAPPPPVDLNNPLFAPAFLDQAASANQLEIASSQLALQLSQNGGVRNLANVLITDHNMMGQQVAAAAASTKLVMPPPALLPADQASLDRLRAAGSGPAFDLAFQQAQISAHQAGIQLMQNYAASGDVPALRAVASQAIPVMQRHLAMAQALQITAAAPPAPPPFAPPTTRRAGERG
jgi:putative membrane protein